MCFQKTLSVQKTTESHAEERQGYNNKKKL